VLILIAAVSIVATPVQADDLKPLPIGKLSVPCSGEAEEKLYLADPGDSRLVVGVRQITSPVVYKLPVENFVPKRAGVRINGGVKMESSGDGEHWTVMFSNYGLGAAAEMSAGIDVVDAARARETGALWVRLSTTTKTSKLERVDFWAEGAALPAGFARVREVNRAVQFVPGILMAVVGLAAILISQLSLRRKWWLPVAGAGLWAASVAVKVVIARLSVTPAGTAIGVAFPGESGKWIFATFIGLLTGVTEVWIFLILMGWMRRRKFTWSDSVALGIGFGAIEAILLGVALLAAVAMKIPGISPEIKLFAPAFERAIAIVAHVASCAMAMYGLITHRWVWFWASFVYKSAVDAVAGYFLYSAGTHVVGTWTMEFAFVPFALLGIGVLWWLRKIWEAPREIPPTTHLSTGLGVS
jgi:hypothetical protein